ARSPRAGGGGVRTSVLYAGRAGYKAELQDGERPALVAPATFRRARELLHRRGRCEGPPARDPITSLLRGLLRCAPCGCAMTPAHSARGVRRYRYYTCTAAQKRGWDTCPSKSVPAGAVERLVLERIRGLVGDPALLGQLLAQAREQEEGRGAALEAEQRGLERDLAGWQAEARHLSLRLCPGGDNGAAVARLADLQERINRVEGRARQVREQLRAAPGPVLDDGAAATAPAPVQPA